MSDQTLGRLTRVDLRDIWTSEASDFTPWLAREDNLAELAETLGINLELEAQEKYVGPFRAVILCKEIDTDASVLVGNQLEQTDHGDLGQLLTYASGLEAVTIVWIAARFTDEHRSTLDWLNKITNGSLRFFGLEVELWRIGDSPAAPKFNIVSKPNDGSHSVTKAARTIDKTALSYTRSRHQAYWSAFLPMLNNSAGPVSSNRNPPRLSYQAFPIGRASFKLTAVTNRPRHFIRSELYIWGQDAKAFFHLLYDQRTEIEQDLGYPLEWEELPAREATRIAVYMNGVDPDDDTDWPRQHEWLATRLNDLHRVFQSRVKALDADDWHRAEAAVGSTSPDSRV